MLKFSRLATYPFVLAREKAAREDSPRETEPMLMEDPDGVAAYDVAGESVLWPIHHLSALGISRLLPEGGTHVDLGCGSGRLLMHLGAGRPDARIIGYDLSEQMLSTGRRLLDQDGLADRVELRRGDITKVDEHLTESPDTMSCNFALHHMPDEDHAVRVLSAIGRIRERTGCGVWISDFVRLRDPRTIRSIVSMIVPSGPSLVEDGIASERASFTMDEMKAMLDRAGLGDLEHARSKPLGEYQVHRAPPRGGKGETSGLWRDIPVPRGSRLLTDRTIRSFPRSLTKQ